MKISVSCASGIEAVTKRELNKLGVINAPAINGRIGFEGDWKTVAECNMYLSTASRVYIELAEFPASDFDELFDGVSDICWERFVSVRGKLMIDVKLVESKLHAITATRAIVKKAIAKRLTRICKTDELSEDGERYRIEVSVFHDVATIALDTSGEGLHKRGYRVLVGEAQIKENVAAALIDLSVWNKERPFADLFCGTGTIAIEAALKAKNVPSGISRSFDFLDYRCFDKRIWEEVYETAASGIDNGCKAVIFASDIDENQLKLCRIHAKRAGVDDIIRIERKDMADFRSDLTRGVVVSNPPYGERMLSRAEIEKLYRGLGKVAENNPDWCFYTLTDVTDFEQLFGKRADKKRKIYNGRIQCFYYTHLSHLKDTNGHRS
ncbi:MAG: class I SAM-dependent RNA methyltransferase [Clostridia bacterium]|nr:class I SAM-dependent RNA methyltransferase [Clostridia bacterium]